MSEQIRSIRVTVEIDTNKRTITQEFTGDELEESFAPELWRAFWKWVMEQLLGD